MMLATTDWLTHITPACYCLGLLGPSKVVEIRTALFEMVATPAYIEPPSDGSYSKAEPLGAPLGQGRRKAQTGVWNNTAST